MIFLFALFVGITVGLVVYYLRKDDDDTWSY